MKKIYSTPRVKEVKLRLERMIAFSVSGNDDNDSPKGKEEDIDFGF